ncbi:MAG: hypothetical protein IKP58_14005 [Victivallales bacterium]|nr:hypothetical protein [Victivallales bacterium]
MKARWLVGVVVLMAAVAFGDYEELQETVKRVRPNVDAEAMMAYYRTNAPDLLEEIEKRRAAYPEAMDAYLGQLADHFQEIDKLRGEDNVMYERKVKEERQQCQVRRLSKTVQQLAKAPAEEGVDAKAEREKQLKAARLQLRKLLEAAFDEAQQQQLIQINRLESEVRDLRRVATERSKNRGYILQERFRTLTGEEWPEEK